jgi:hypothetical protein
MLIDLRSDRQTFGDCSCMQVFGIMHAAAATCNEW